MLTFLLLLLTSTFLATCYYLWQLSKQLRTCFFILTEGKIIFLERSEERALSGKNNQFSGHRLKIRVKYEYYVDNNRFVNNKLYYGEPKVFYIPIYHIDAISHFINMLVVNEKVEVFYNSRNPQEACLIDGVRSSTILILTILLIIMAGCVFCLISADTYKYVSDNAIKVCFLITFPVFMYIMYVILSDDE